IQHRSTTAWHPQANAQVERFHRTLKDSLRAHCANGDWVDQLPLIMLGIRNLAVADSGLSPSQLAFGAPTRLPGCFATSTEATDPAAPFIDRLRAIVRNLQPPDHVWHGNNGRLQRDPKLDTTSHV